MQLLTIMFFQTRSEIFVLNKNSIFHGKKRYPFCHDRKNVLWQKSVLCNGTRAIILKSTNEGNFKKYESKVN